MGLGETARFYATFTLLYFKQYQLNETLLLLDSTNKRLLYICTLSGARPTGGIN